MFISIVIFGGSSTNVGTKNIQDCLAQLLGVLCQMEKFVNTAQANRNRIMSEVLNSIFQTFLSLSAFDILIGFSLSISGIFHCLGASIGNYES